MIYSPENLWKEREQSKQSKASSLIYLLKFLDIIRLEFWLFPLGSGDLSKCAVFGMCSFRNVPFFEFAPFGMI